MTLTDSEKLAGLSKLQGELNKPWRDEGQIKTAEIMFNWWWNFKRDYPLQPEWEKCDWEIQAFWMDGAWRVMNG